MKIIITIILIILLPISILTIDKYQKINQANVAVFNNKFVINTWKTKNGAEVYFIANNNQFIDIEISFDAGLARDDNKPGLSELVAQIVASSQKTNVKYKLEPDRVKFRLNLNNNKNKLLFKSLDLSLFTSMKQQLIKNIKNTNTPRKLAIAKLHKLLYNNHPYSSNGLIVDSKINIKDIISFYRKYYTAINCTVTIVGNVKKKEAQAIVDLITFNLKSGIKPALLPNVSYVVPKHYKTIIDYNANYATVALGQAVATVDDNNYFDLIIGNFILANSFYSRLQKQFRDYNINSQLLLYNKAGPLVLTFDVKPENANQVINQIKSRIAEFIANGPFTEELELAKTRLINNFPMQLINNEDLLAWGSYIGFYKLPLDFLDRYLDNISMVSPESVTRAWQQRLNSNLMATVVVEYVK